MPLLPASWNTLHTTRNDILNSQYISGTSIGAATVSNVSWNTNNCTSASISYTTLGEILPSDIYATYPVPKVEPEELTKDELVVELREKIEGLEEKKEELEKRAQKAESYLRGVQRLLEDLVCYGTEPSMLRSLLGKVVRKTSLIERFLKPDDLDQEYV